MNTSDQNVYTLDSAFKRRWNMIYVSNDFVDIDENGNETYDKKIGDMYVPMKKCNICWRKFIEVVNEFIVNINSYGIHSEDKQIGKYFVGEVDLLEKSIDEYDDYDNALKSFSEKVLMYLWDDIAKLDVKRWFNDDIKTFDKLLSEYQKNGIDVFSFEIKEKLKENSNLNNDSDNNEEVSK